MGYAIYKKRLFYTNDVENCCAEADWKAKFLKRGYLSAASFPLMTMGKIVGGLAVYSMDENFFDEEEIHLMNEISTTLSFTLDALEEENRRMRAEKALVTSENATGACLAPVAMRCSFSPFRQMAGPDFYGGQCGCV